MDDVVVLMAPGHPGRRPRHPAVRLLPEGHAAPWSDTAVLPPVGDRLSLRPRPAGPRLRGDRRLQWCCATALGYPSPWSAARTAT
jgi:hypothetical protein